MNRLQQLMMEAGYASFVALAAYTGIERRVLSGIAHGRRAATTAQVEALAAALGVQPETVLIALGVPLALEVRVGRLEQRVDVLEEGGA